jgi:hypothetical protein
LWCELTLDGLECLPIETGDHAAQSGKIVVSHACTRIAQRSARKPVCGPAYRVPPIPATIVLSHFGDDRNHIVRRRAAFDQRVEVIVPGGKRGGFLGEKIVSLVDTGNDSAGRLAHVV